MSSLARRRNTAIFGSRRWWQGGCWATRAHQEAYLRKLYSRKNVEGAAQGMLGIGSDTTPGITELCNGRETSASWPSNHDVEQVNDASHYLDNFLRNRQNDENDDSGCATTNNAISVLPSTESRPSPTEKCVEFLTGARSCVHFSDNTAALFGQQIEESQSPCHIEVTEHNLDRILHSGYQDVSA